jgi:hypothetical protein
MNKIITFLALSTLMLASCKRDLQFEDPNKLTYEEYLKLPGAAVKVGSGAVIGVMNTVLNGATGVHLLCMADQITSTNRYLEFWDWAQEPRLAIKNADTYGGYGAIADYWAGFAQANLDANAILLQIRAGEPIKDANGNDRTSDSKIAAYFAKGLANGYLGAIYDRGVIVNGRSSDVPTFTDYPNSYKEMVQNGVAYMDSAIAAANAATSFNFNFIPGLTINKTQFVAWCNGMAARMMASVPRDNAEALALGASWWNKVYDYANAGPSADLIYEYANESVYPGTLDWAIYLLGDGAGYLPVDIKVAHLVDRTGTYPNYYPAAPTLLSPVQTDDARFNVYFSYTPNFGFLRADRNRGLFTNYARARWDNVYNFLAVPGAVSPFWQNEETTLLKAEAKLMAGDAAAAAGILNNPSYSRKALGNLPNVPANAADVKKALHWEYSVCIDAASGPVPPYAFMRRQNLLIGGTPTELPVPLQQMKVVGGNAYTFGGKANAGAKEGKFNEVTTAANVGWKLSQ